MAYADAGQISVALMQMLRNALEAMPDGGVCGSLAAARATRRSSKSSTPVSDSPKKVWSEPPSPFIQKKSQCTGLGLSIAAPLLPPPALVGVEQCFFSQRGFGGSLRSYPAALALGVIGRVL